MKNTAVSGSLRLANGGHGNWSGTAGLLELFLHDVLKYSWDEVHEEAERLEHSSRSDLKIGLRQSSVIRKSIRMVI